jgi:Peptidase family M23
MTLALPMLRPTASFAAATPAGPVAACRRPDVPPWLHPSLTTAIHVSRDLRPSWAGSPYLAKILCWQGTDLSVRFLQRSAGYHVWHGIFAMTTEEMQTVAGQWLTRTRGGYELRTPCFVHGWDVCSHTTGHARIMQQLIAGLRWIWLTYGSPRVAWAHIVRTGRFDSLPRPGTHDAPTRAPLALCPVADSVTYRDDFGERRTVGGYHPHWGNDIYAPTGRPIRAPFDGLAVAHSDNWFAGNYVTVVGARGFVRNGHLRAFAHLGWVKTGTVIGYLGATGDARGPHDHFEWHPWVVPTPRHRSPSGFIRVMDAIDPFPFLNRACGRAAAPSAAALVAPAQD